MSDLDQYIQDRKARDPEFADGYDEGYESFKFGNQSIETIAEISIIFPAFYGFSGGTSSRRVDGISPARPSLRSHKHN
ncbi:hypothetical protein [Endozoicomonas sp. 4G]|uniref:hypothetical protein n=1 Tax=Endozoicomonas sp. 4G TaxID=2872754 RepID=UPI002078AC83|nr:hypothetical protein [Endozoicomonas sp. 4G]